MVSPSTAAPAQVQAVEIAAKITATLGGEQCGSGSAAAQGGSGPHRHAAAHGPGRRERPRGRGGSGRQLERRVCAALPGLQEGAGGGQKGGAAGGPREAVPPPADLQIPVTAFWPLPPSVCRALSTAACFAPACSLQRVASSLAFPQSEQRQERLSAAPRLGFPSCCATGMAAAVASPVQMAATALAAVPGGSSSQGGLAGEHHSLEAATKPSRAQWDADVHVRAAEAAPPAGGGFRASPAHAARLALL